MYNIIEDYIVLELIHKCGYQVDPDNILRTNAFGGNNFVLVYINKQMMAFVSVDHTNIYTVNLFQLDNIVDNTLQFDIPKKNDKLMKVTYEITDYQIYKLLEEANVYGFDGNSLIYKCRADRNTAWVQGKDQFMEITYDSSDKEKNYYDLNTFLLSDIQQGRTYNFREDNGRFRGC